MSQQPHPTSKPESPRGLSGPLAAAMGVLLISLALSVVLMAGWLGRSAAPSVNSETITPDTPSPETPTITLTGEASPEAALDATNTAQHGTVISLAALGNDAPALGERLAGAIQAALSGSILQAEVTIQALALPPDRLSAADIDPSRDAPGSDLLIVWENAGDGLVRLYLIGAFDPPIPTVDGTLISWAIPMPGSIPLYVSETDDMALPAGLAVGLLETQAGASEQASGRFQALQALPSSIPLDKARGNQAIILFALAQTQTARGDLTGALQTYSQALRLQNDFTEAAINRGNVYLALGDAAAALNAYSGAFDSGPDQAAALYNQVLAYRMSGDLDSALAAATQAVESAPNTLWSLDLRGIVCYLRSDYPAALADFSAASQVAPDMPAPLINQALAAYALGDYQQALTFLDKLLELEPNNPVFHLYQGRVYQASGDPVRARYALNRAIDLDHSYLEAYLQRARLFFETGDNEKAQADAEQAISLNPDDGRAYQIVGDVLLAQEDFEGAEDAYSAAIERGIENTEIFAGRGWARQRLHYAAGAVADYQEALSLGSSDATLLFRLGFALFDVGRYPESQDALLGAINGGLDTAEAHAALALALDANLRRDEAEQEFQHALDLDPRYGDRDFLKDQPLWSQRAISRAVSILRRMGVNP